MIRVRVIFFLVMLTLIQNTALAQYDEEVFSTEVLLRKEYYGGIFINSAGGGMEFRKGANTTYFTKWLYEVNLLELKSNRETRVYNPFYRNSRSFVYGKLNNLYVLRVGGGQQKLLNRKPYWGGVELRYFWFAGGTAGFTKPVYLYIIKELTINPPYYEYSLIAEKYDPNKHFLDNIYGRASLTKGFNEISIHPGVYAKAGLSFEIGRQNQKVSAVEIGAALDFFPTGVRMMAVRDPERFFLTFFVGYYLGKRYN
ncbi:MAG: hypothetical protein IH597_06270 [Bacteroidales bacterium]|nr:hypothetical protein [Bacteroidales bacterium]